MWLAHLSRASRGGHAGWAVAGPHYVAPECGLGTAGRRPPYADDPDRQGDTTPRPASTYGSSLLCAPRQRCLSHNFWPRNVAGAPVAGESRWTRRVGGGRATLRCAGMWAWHRRAPTAVRRRSRPPRGHHTAAGVDVRELAAVRSQAAVPEPQFLAAKCGWRTCRGRVAVDTHGGRWQGHITLRRNVGLAPPGADRRTPTIPTAKGTPHRGRRRRTGARCCALPGSGA